MIPHSRSPKQLSSATLLFTFFAFVVAVTPLGCTTNAPAKQATGTHQSQLKSQASAVRNLLIPPARPGQGWGVCYGPHRDGQTPNTGPQPTREQIRQDVHIMAQHWRMVRMYGQGEATQWVAEIIREDKLPLKLLSGVWIAAEIRLDDKGETVAIDDSLAEQNRKQVSDAIKLANDFPDVVMALGVGNETQVSWSGYRTPGHILLAYINQVRAGVRQPVTTCDDFNFWNKPESKAIAQACDFIALHAYAMWNKQLLPDSLAWTREQIASIEAYHPDRTVILTELGWATQKGTEGYQAIGIVAEPGERPQEFFYRTLEHWATQVNQPYFYFEAFDEKWKGGSAPDEVEKHWGVYASDRTPKLVMQVPSREGKARQ